ncbi:hypothetical protein [Massilia oculi]|uniref:hypothetical protein n=1 Tax=Massilia oculi TaxID=945844 RepID=UPI001AAFD13E|nr:hypothetical protein [Massilia oculi]
MKRTVQSAVLAGMMAFGLAACNTTDTSTDSMSGSTGTGATIGSGVQTPSTTGGANSWNSGANGSSGVNAASGTTSNNEQTTDTPVSR